MKCYYISKAVKLHIIICVRKGRQGKKGEGRRIFDAREATGRQNLFRYSSMRSSASMENSAIGHSGSSSSSRGGLVKYYGRSVIVPGNDPVFKQLIPTLIQTLQEIQQSKPMTIPAAQWNAFTDEFKAFANLVANPHHPWRRYQLDIIADVLIPYLTKLKGRIHTDQSRTRQLLTILHALSLPDNPHPAVALNMLEAVKNSIKEQQSYFFTSELMTSLDISLAKQWRPILSDLCIFLRNISGKLLFIGAMFAIGWPMIFLSPLLFYAKSLIGMIKELEQHRRLSAESLYVLFKVGIISFALTRLMVLFEMMSSLGYICLGSAVLCYGLTLENSLLKAAAPMIAPNIGTIDDIMQSLGRLDGDSILKSLAHVGGNIGGSLNTDRLQPNPQVEELTNDENEGKEDGKQDGKEDGKVEFKQSSGIRQRKSKAT